MKRLLLIPTFLLSAMIGPGQEINSGSVELDATILDINASAKKDIHSYRNDLSITFSTPLDLIDKMFSAGMTPGEVYLGLEIAKVTSKSPNDIIKSYEINKDKGWGAIAKDMGIKPGSPLFHQLKKNAKATKSQGKPAKAGTPTGKKGPAKVVKPKGKAKGRKK